VGVQHQQTRIERIEPELARDRASWQRPIVP
jgi:hypothetical protein